MKWLLLEEDAGWQTIVPESDKKPHATSVLVFPDGEEIATLADFDCPCKPEVDFKNKLIIHNEF
jgi:hypothetical protein